MFYRARNQNKWASEIGFAVISITYRYSC